MEQRRNFGRRAVPQSTAPVAAIPGPADPPRSLFPAPQPDSPLPSIDDEIAAWKAERGSVVSFPWRQLSLMAGLCFGIASFVLPATINDAVQWPLYALTAASLYAGLRKRKTTPGLTQK